MKIFKKIVDLQNELFLVRKEGKTVGLVPTMGALHEGHASLIRRSVKENDVTVVSIFLNPTQFNDKGDLERYPRNPESDQKVVEDCKADYCFAPSVEEIYPTPDPRHFEFPPVTTVMEGAHRPGHFNGVCQVVSRLFYIVRPDRAYFGEKDWQQIAVVKRLVKYIGMKIQIVVCPVVREKDGLAMSSRNALLTADERKIAPKIYELLKASIDFGKEHTVKETHDKVVEDINAVEGLTVEYFSIVNGDTLQDVDSWDACPNISGCIAVNCGSKPIRLIDHISYKENK
ncbi:MAG: pantoate--beta-alanine ligase [Prevotella sp.]|jgi:pantoate--beta-alanine ligase|nr:pantoate--beta-alanine ligase [Prevotella sp.]MCH3985523.1 pantoate--beta-alanine ligase [Prevotella sp.]MCH3991738.1 pantoate--beta-alanine ligase [Prevotella sp.]MCH4017704.1 pantoate--beta-alanine ligase [Prevotella sp.]MCH4185932.1 pantoate--beta-alanine ligase [Prevotella sp.]